MKNKNYFILFVILGLTGCTMDDEPKPWQENIAQNLTDKHWGREFHVSSSDKEFDVYEIWKFNMDATGSFKTITTYQNGEKEEIITYFKWTFTTEHFDIIYMDYPRYWQIEQLTSEKLCVNQTYEDPLEKPEESKDYREYSAIN